MNSKLLLEKLYDIFNKYKKDEEVDQLDIALFANKVQEEISNVKSHFQKIVHYKKIRDLLKETREISLMYLEEDFDANVEETFNMKPGFCEEMIEFYKELTNKLYDELEREVDG